MLHSLKLFFSSKNTTSSIFIHIPKTGGSSFVGLLKDSISLTSEQMNTPTHKIENIGNIKIQHIDFNVSGRKFKAYKIFNDSKNDEFLKEKIFLLIRNPASRLLSEYNFQYHILNGKAGNKKAAIIAQLKSIPHCFEDYYSSKETQDYQCKFLIGRNLADPKPISEKEFESIINTIDKLNIHCGVTERYFEFLNLFANETNYKLKNKITHRKQTPNHINTTLTKLDIAKIEKLNKYDYLLYKFILNKVNEVSLKNEISFTLESSNSFIV